MARSEEISEGQISIHEPENDEQSVINKDGEFWVDLNESKINSNSSELLKTIRELKAELQSVKEDNERILKALEELNLILMSKINNPRIEKSKEHKSDEETVTCKQKKRS